MGMILSASFLGLYSQTVGSCAWSLWNVREHKGALRISAIMLLMRDPAVRHADGFQAISVSASVCSEGLRVEENKTGIGFCGHTHAHSMFPKKDNLPPCSRWHVPRSMPCLRPWSILSSHHGLLFLFLNAADPVLGSSLSFFLLGHSLVIYPRMSPSSSLSHWPSIKKVSPESNWSMFRYT